MLFCIKQTQYVKKLFFSLYQAKQKRVGRAEVEVEGEEEGVDIFERAINTKKCKPCEPG